LRVGEKKELAMRFLEPHPVLQRSDIMPKVKRAGCPIAGENGGFFSQNWIHGDSPVWSRRDRETC
jgi:hypothetical protein